MFDPAELLAVLTASLAGSLHCAAMCGGFATAAAGGLDGGVRPHRARWRLAAYAAGRAVGYAGLGALAGFAGVHLQLAGEAITGLQSWISVATGVLLVTAGVFAIAGWTPGGAWRGDANDLVALRRREARPGLIRRLRLVLGGFWARQDAWGAGALGLASALLPCGWLWAFVVLALGSGSTAAGAILMLVFWLGTVPALTGVGWLSSAFGRRLSPHAPRVVAGVMIALGLWALLGRWSSPDALDALGGEPCRHELVDGDGASP